MVLLVPFDGSTLSEAALVRASAFAAAFEIPVLAVSVIPKGNTEYARNRGWLDPDETFDLQTVVASLHRRVTELCPSADFRHELVDRYATPGLISKQLRKVAKKEDAAMVFIGSENAGRIVAGISSVGAGVATDTAYDVVIVRHTEPARIATLEEHTPSRGTNSE